MLFSASLLIQQNVIALIDEGGHTKTSSCALSTLTNIPLIRLNGHSTPFSQCEKLVQMSPGYKDYAHASLAILKTFRWENAALVFDGTLKYNNYIYFLTKDFDSMWKGTGRGAVLHSKTA